MANRIKEFRSARGLSFVRLGELAGTTGPQIQKLERGERKLTVDWMVRLARALTEGAPDHHPVEPKDLLPPEGQAPTAEHHRQARRTGLAATGPITDMVEVRGAARGGDDQEMYLLDGAIDRIRRPLQLENVRDAYAMQVTGSSMEPRYWDGQIVYVNPHKRPRMHSGVIIVKPSNAVLVKEFLRWLGDGGAKVREYAPESRDFEVPRDEIAVLHTIVGSEEP